jgi:Fe-S-cluster-containing hydrogenase component 2
MIQISHDRCIGCGTCVGVCPKGALFVAGGHADVDEMLCDSCGLCIPACPEGAISMGVKAAESREVQPLGISQPPTPAKSQSRSVVASWTKSIAPAVGAVIAFAGREILPRIVDTWLAARAPSRTAGTGSAANEARRLRRRRRGKS